MANPFPYPRPGIQFTSPAPGPMGTPLDLSALDIANDQAGRVRPRVRFTLLPRRYRPVYPTPYLPSEGATEKPLSNVTVSLPWWITAASIAVPAGLVIYFWDRLKKGSAWSILALAMLLPVVMMIVLGAAVVAMTPVAAPAPAAE